MVVGLASADGASAVAVCTFSQVPSGRSASISILCHSTPGDPPSSAALVNVPHAANA
jgi:hypothetical protein